MHEETAATMTRDMKEEGEGGINRDECATDNDKDNNNDDKEDEDKKNDVRVGIEVEIMLGGPLLMASEGDYSDTMENQQDSNVNGEIEPSYSSGSMKTLEESEVMFSPTDQQISKGLSHLGRSADGIKYVFLKLSLPHAELENIEILARFQHIQTLVLSYNNLFDLTPLSTMKHLLHLDASHNEIETILDFEPPFNIKHVDLSHNRINHMSDLSAHRCLQHLILDFNSISDIEGLSGCVSLTHLSLRSNRLERISNLDGLPLKALALSGNRIKKIENLESLSNLKSIDLSNNQVRSLRGLQGHGLLQHIHLKGNDIINITEVKYIKDLELLCDLNLLDNPIMKMPDHRLALVFRLQRLTFLDSQPVTAEEKVAAVNRHNPPAEVVAALDHARHVTREVRRTAQLRCNTPPINAEYETRPLVLVGPSGAGKRTLSKKLLNDYPGDFGFVVSHTTRAPRPGEVHGVDYYFTTHEDMEEMIDVGMFVETVRFFGHTYGTSIDGVERVAKMGKVCIIDLALEGMLSLKKTYLNARFVLIMPPSADVHRERLAQRGTEAEGQMDCWVKTAKDYLEYSKRPGMFDNIIINNDLDTTYESLLRIVSDDIRSRDINRRSQNKINAVAASRISRTSSTDDMALRGTSRISVTDINSTPSMSPVRRPFAPIPPSTESAVSPLSHLAGTQSVPPTSPDIQERYFKRTSSQPLFERPRRLSLKDFYNYDSDGNFLRDKQSHQGSAEVYIPRPSQTVMAESNYADNESTEHPDTPDSSSSRSSSSAGIEMFDNGVPVVVP